MFFWNSLAFPMIQPILAIWSLVPLPFLKPAWTSGSSRFTYCWSLSWRILSITLLVCDMSAIVWITINWKILKEMGIPDHLTCLLRNLYAGQEATVRTRHGTTDWFQIRKGVHQGCILSPYLVNLHAEYIIQNARLGEAQAGIKIAGRNINNLR